MKTKLPWKNIWRRIKNAEQNPNIIHFSLRGGFDFEKNYHGIDLWNKQRKSIRQLLIQSIVSEYAFIDWKAAWRHFWDTWDDYNCNENIKNLGMSFQSFVKNVIESHILVEKNDIL